jgi:GNAT superfamily N-acetyltransferase
MKIQITEEQYNRLIEGFVNFPIDDEITLEVWEDKNKLELSSIVIPKEYRGQGKGTEIMNMVINYADKVNKPLYLTPDTNFGGTSINRLKRFYRRFDFIKNDNYEVKHSMVRYPKETKQMDIEEEYPINWNIDEFKNLKSFNQRIQYCEKNLQRISSGSGRVVYKIDDTKVLKLAKNQKGVAQNNTEIGFSDDYMWDGMIAEIFNYDENGLWVEMELARKVTPKIWDSIIGIPIEELHKSARFVDQQKNPRKYQYHFTRPQRMDEVYDNEFTSNILDLIGNYDIGPGDFGRLSTYGLVKRNGQDNIVIIDYGLTNDVYDSYYK